MWLFFWRCCWRCGGFWFLAVLALLRFVVVGGCLFFVVWGLEYLFAQGRFL
jgi:hypothetical protein